MDARGLSEKQLLWWFWSVAAISILIPLVWIAVAEHELSGLPQPNTVGAPLTFGLAVIEGLAFDVALWVLAIVVLLVWSAVRKRRQGNRTWPVTGLDR